MKIIPGFRIVAIMLLSFICMACGTNSNSGTSNKNFAVAQPTSSSKSITSFSISNPNAAGYIDDVNKTINVYVPFDTPVTSLIVTFITTGAQVTVGSTLQVSGKTTNDFTAPVVYTVIAKDNSTVNYTVSVLRGSYVTLKSDAGDYIGQGTTYQYNQTQANVLFTPDFTSTRFSIRLDIDKDNINKYIWWTGAFQEPNSLTQLQAGTYNSLTRYPFNDPIIGGLNWDGDGRGCNTLTGSFTINNVKYDTGILKAINLSFVQHCEGSVPALTGEVQWVAN